LVFTGANTTPATGTLSFGVSANTLTIAGGTGYVVNDILNVVGGGGAGGQLRVLTIDGSGGILTYNLANAGQGYTSAPTAITDLTTPAGTGASVTGNDAFSVA